MKNTKTLYCIGLLLMLGLNPMQTKAAEGHRLLEHRLSDINWPDTKAYLISEGLGNEKVIYQTGMMTLLFLDAQEKNLLGLVTPAKQETWAYGEEGMRYNGFVHPNGELIVDMAYGTFRQLAFGVGILAPVMSAEEKAQLVIAQLTTELAQLQEKVAAELATANAANQKSEVAIQNLANNTLVLTKQANVTSETISDLKEQLQSAWEEVAAGKEVSNGHNELLVGLSFDINDLSILVSEKEAMIENLTVEMKKENAATNLRIDSVNNILNGYIETTNSTFWYTWIGVGIALAVAIVGIMILGYRKIKPVKEKLAALDAKVTNVTEVVVKTEKSMSALKEEMGNYDFDESLITAAKLNELSDVQSISLKLKSKDNGEVKVLLIQVKTNLEKGEKQVLVYGALCRIDSDQPLTLDSTKNVATCIRRAGSSGRIIGLVEQKLAKAG